MKNKLRGFTLIELLVVIAIIAILASIIMASLNQARTKSRDARRIADVKSLQTAIQLYNNDSGAYPPNLGALVPNFISVLPTDPQSNAQYAYAPLSSVSEGDVCNSFHLGTTLESTNTATTSSAAVTASENTTTADSRGFFLCNVAGASADFDGTATYSYDVIP